MLRGASRSRATVGRRSGQTDSVEHVFHGSRGCRVTRRPRDQPAVPPPASLAPARRACACSACSGAAGGAKAMRAGALVPRRHRRCRRAGRATDSGPWCGQSLARSSSATLGFLPPATPMLPAGPFSPPPGSSGRGVDWEKGGVNRPPPFFPIDAPRAQGTWRREPVSNPQGTGRSPPARR